MELTINKYKEKDEIKILNLFQESFTREMTLDYWKWRYDKSYQKYIYLMFDKDRAVGHYAVFPVKVYFNNHKINSGFSMTTMTSPDYKNLGIFKSLAKKLYEDCFNDLDIIWGFPNNNSLHGFAKHLNWKNVFDINMLKFDLKDLSEEMQIDKRITNVNYFTNDYNDLIDKISNNYSMMVYKDSDYLNWRYVRNPINKYYILEYRESDKLKGYCVYKIYSELDKKYGDIVDILASDTKVFQELIRSALRNIKMLNAEGANIWMLDDKHISILEELGFEYSGNKTHFGLCINSDKDYVKKPLNISKIYLTMGDSDVF